MARDRLHVCSRQLIDALFHERDQQLLHAFRERLDKISRREQLARICGLHDEVLLDRLLELGVPAEALAAIAVVPLVVVAWADRQVQEKERQAIIRAAQEAGVQPQDGRYPILEYWLSQAPGPELLEAWKQYIAALCRRMTPAQIADLKRELLDEARAVAQAAGGILGVGNKISPKERAALKELEQAFG